MQQCLIYRQRGIIRWNIYNFTNILIVDNYNTKIQSAQQKVTHPQALDFINTFLLHRDINREYFLLVHEEKYDAHLVNNEKTQSDSPRKNLTHQIDTTRDYINGLLAGELYFGRQKEYDDLQKPETLSKDQLINKLDESTLWLIKILQQKNIDQIVVKVPWSVKSIPALQMIWGLNNHEILHTGWNLAYMDFLGIPRFQKLKAMWG